MGLQTGSEVSKDHVRISPWPIDMRRVWGSLTRRQLPPGLLLYARLQLLQHPDLAQLFGAQAVPQDARRLAHARRSPDDLCVYEIPVCMGEEGFMSLGRKIR